MDKLWAMNNPQPLSTDLRLRTDIEVCQEVGLSIHRFRRMRRKHLIPFIKLGYRSFRYDPVDVRNALNKLKVKAVA
jgi:hypothetical protein